jgi:L-alanine-DL-glutamate epimerase-like enolase superfamily enzyme
MMIIVKIETFPLRIPF